MGANKNSSRGICLLQQDELGWSNTSPTQTTQVYQSHIATQVLLTLGTNHSTNRNKHSQHAVEICSTCYLCHTGETDGLRRSDWWIELVLTVYIMKVHMDLQADKSPVVVKGPFFPRVVNPRYRICGTMCNARIQSSKARKAIYWRTKLHLI
jgi:hypothetical protein